MSIGTPKIAIPSSEVMTSIKTANQRGRSWTTPTTAINQDIGRHPNISNAPSITTGLPHPGCSTINRT